MCGITGFIDFRKTSDASILGRMTDTIIHRGPDDSGNEFYASSDAHIGLGFRRLSIIDLSTAGHQPMHFAEKGLSIVFNGEIYNYREIREELKQAGYIFQSQSDTEVILKSYDHWGIACVKKFIGMFAIALHDRPHNKTIFIRDRAGVKPLYWYFKDGLFLFGSELKTLHAHSGFWKELNTDALSLFFQRGYISAPYTIFCNTYKLLPGHYLEVDLKNQSHQVHKYWDVADAYNAPKSDLSYEEAKAGLEDLMLSAFQYRMIADVPVGVFLSGGYDSTAVAAMLQKHSSAKIKTFTIGFDDPRFNEASHAKAVAERIGTEHHEYLCTYKDALDILPDWASVYDEPFGDTSGIPTLLVSRLARKTVTVALSADGGDEIFAGYPKYFNALKRIKNLTLPGAGLASRFMPMGGVAVSRQNKRSKLREFYLAADEVKKFDIISQSMTFYETGQLIARPVQSLPTPFEEAHRLNDTNDGLAKFQATDYKTYLADDILQKVDRATMRVSLEGREPFLDHRLIEYAARLPSGYKYRAGRGKAILKDIVHQYVPSELMERPKMGFGVPLSKWLRNELRGLLTDMINEQSLRTQQVFRPAAAMKMRDDFLAGRKVEEDRLQYLFLFQLWYHQWMS